MKKGRQSAATKRARFGTYDEMQSPLLWSIRFISACNVANCLSVFCQSALARRLKLPAARSRSPIISHAVADEYAPSKNERVVRLAARPMETSSPGSHGSPEYSPFPELLTLITCGLFTAHFSNIYMSIYNRLRLDIQVRELKVKEKGKDAAEAKKGD